MVLCSGNLEENAQARQEGLVWYKDGWASVGDANTTAIFWTKYDKKLAKIRRAEPAPRKSSF